MGVSPVAILCNGHSLLDHAKLSLLQKIPCETIGINASWEVLTSSCHVMIDPLQWERYTRITGNNPSAIPNLYTGPIGPKSAIHINILDTVEPKFSFNVTEFGAWLCGSVAWVALQVAVSMRKSPIYFFGLDLQPRWVAGELRGKFWGGIWDTHAEARQRELFGYARGLLGHSGIEIINVVINQNDTKCQAFPKRTFAQCFPQEMNNP